MSQGGGIGTPGRLNHPVGDSLLSDWGQDRKTVTFPEVRTQFSRKVRFAKRGDAGADWCVDLGGRGEEGKGVGPGCVWGWPAFLVAGGRGAQRLLKSSFFLLQSICGARLLLRFWWALSLATAREMLKSRMGSEEEEEVGEGAVQSCFLRLSWEFSC